VREIKRRQKVMMSSWKCLQNGVETTEIKNTAQTLTQTLTSKEMDI